MIEAMHDSKTKILDAALHVIRAKGYSATRIEDVCEAARLTKGSFFHHFKSKEDLALEAAAYWEANCGDCSPRVRLRRSRSCTSAPPRCCSPARLEVARMVRVRRTRAF